MHKYAYDFKTSTDQNNTFVYKRSVNSRRRSVTEPSTEPSTEQPSTNTNQRNKTPKSARWIPFFIILGIVIIIMVLV